MRMRYNVKREIKLNDQSRPDRNRTTQTDYIAKKCEFIFQYYEYCPMFYQF